MNLLGFILLAVTAAAVSAASTGKDSCTAAATAAGVNMTTFAANVAHNTHSITVGDIQYFFEADFPEKNTIPTVNTNLNKDQNPVLSSAPVIKSMFKFPAFASFDFILSNNDHPDRFLANGLTTLEKLSHQMHMQEMWMKASIMYKQIKTRNLDTASICPCLVDEQNNGIIEHLIFVADDLKDWMPEPIVDGNRQLRTSRRQKRADRDIGIAVDIDICGFSYSFRYRFSYRCQARPSQDDQSQRSGRALDLDAVQLVPELKDAKSWNYWQQLLMNSMLSDDEIYNFAMYMHCKINA
jgi:hypothetical protein